jgi:hypothetical protein
MGDDVEIGRGDGVRERESERGGGRERERIHRIN